MTWSNVNQTTKDEIAFLGGLGKHRVHLHGEYFPERVASEDKRKAMLRTYLETGKARRWPGNVDSDIALEHAAALLAEAERV